MGEHGATQTGNNAKTPWRGAKRKPTHDGRRMLRKTPPYSEAG